MTDQVGHEGGREHAYEEMEPHLSPQTMSTYLRGELDGGDENEVQEHLASCPDCVDRLLLDPAAWETADGGNGVRSFEAALAWRALQDKLALERLRRWQRPGLAAAAALVLALGLSLAQNAVIGERLEVLDRPQLNVPISDLDPYARQRGEPLEITVAVSDEAAFYALVMPIESQEGPLEEVTVEIAEAAGELVWSGRGLEIDAYGSATMALPHDFLDPGSYRIRLFSDVEGEPPRQIGDYEVKIPEE